MLVYANPNTANSIQLLAGSSWQIFFMPKTFDPETIETIDFKYLCANHVGVVNATSFLLPSRAIKFVHTNKAMPNLSIGLEETEPSDFTGSLYRVGVKDVVGTNLTDYDKMRLLFENNVAYSIALSSIDPGRVLEFELAKEVSVDQIVFQSNGTYSVECFTTSWVPFVAGTVCSKIRITLGYGSITTTSIKVYTHDELSVEENLAEIGFAVLVPNKLIAGDIPLMVVDVTDWRTTGTARINETIQAAAHCPTLSHLELLPILLEI